VSQTGVSRRADVVLFDLDGTLIDSAPDLAATVNHMRLTRGLTEVDYPRLRARVGSGARGMLLEAFDKKPGDAEYETMRQEFMTLYAERLLDTTRVFEAMEPVLQTLEAQGVRWGIVTNKNARMAEHIAQGLGLHVRHAVLIGGDTTPHAKPHPAPLLEAARRIGVDPLQCVYVGDDERDVLAGRAAGMATLAAAWGYLGVGESVHAWGADAVIESPSGLLHWLAMP
jgi:N-acetyl-D-muramate 6-phosphate phosphatase